MIIHTNSATGEQFVEQEFAGESVSCANANASLIMAHRKRLELEAKSQRRRFKAGRNSLCPCGSGKKFKNCCYV